jgi:hypothetical protein
MERLPVFCLHFESNLSLRMIFVSQMRLACIQLEQIYRTGKFGVPVDFMKADVYANASDIEKFD